MRLLKIGRSATNNIVLNSERVSTLHAELILLDSGEMLLVDKSSTNGTFVNNKRILLAMMSANIKGWLISVKVFTTILLSIVSL